MAELTKEQIVVGTARNLDATARDSSGSEVRCAIVFAGTRQVPAGRSSRCSCHRQAATQATRHVKFTC
jgi:hypothetical protein